MLQNVSKPLVGEPDTLAKAIGELFHGLPREFIVKDARRWRDGISSGQVTFPWDEPPVYAAP